MIYFGDIVRIETNDWELFSKRLKVLAIKYREDSSAAELLAQEIPNETIHKIVCDRKRIIKEAYEDY